MSSKKNSTKPVPKASKKPQALKPRAKAPVAAHAGQPPVRLAQRTIGAPQSSFSRNPSTRGLTSGPMGVGLSSAAMQYAKAMCNPFGEFEELPCIPSSPPAETYRFRALQRFSFTTGTAGYGFVSMDPTQPANDQPYVNYTGATYGGTGFAEAPGTGISQQPNLKLPYDAASFAVGQSTFTFRLVAAGLRIRNVTQALNVGGMLLGIRLPGDEENSVSQLSWADTASSPYAVLLSSSLDKQADWKTLVWVPTNTAQLTLSNVNEGTNFIPTLGFLAQAPAVSTPQTFEVETIQFFEFGGQYKDTAIPAELSLPSVEVSYADSVGLDRVLHGATYLVPALTTEENVENLANGVVEAFAHSDSTAKTVEDLLGSVGKSLLSASKLAGTLIKWLAI